MNTMTSIVPLPTLSFEAQAFVRIVYGALLAATLLWALPHGRRFFVSERWGGYIESGSWMDLLHSPRLYPIVMTTWIACAILIATGVGVVWAALVNLVICRHFFIGLRWRSALRGMGAPGFMSYWLAVAVLLLEAATRWLAPARPLVVFTLQVDLALVMLSAGVYKVSAGFAQNDGMELGLANPAWGYWWRRYSALPPGHWLFWVLNQLAWTTEVTAGVLFLIPATRTAGGLLLIATFFFIVTQIRLAFLCEMVMTCGVLYFAAGSAPDRVVASLVDFVPPPAAAAATPAIALTLVSAMLWSYVALLPLVHAALFYNFYARRRLPPPLQWMLERYTNLFGIIIWRVFTSDLVNFFIRIYRQDRTTGARVLLSRYGLEGGLRFGHVAESITVTCVFTTLKYYASNRALFDRRLLRYARTLAAAPSDLLLFEYVSVLKAPSRFEFVPVAEYLVDPTAGSVRETVIRQDVSVQAAHAGSPLHEGAAPGSYAPVNPV